MATDAGAVLLPIARASIARALGRAMDARDDASWLQEPAATFVTLTRNGRLRGCVGTLQAERCLLEDVRANAIGAALHDPRFVPVAAHEFDQIMIGVSLLSATQDMEFSNERDALAQLRPGIDGLVFECHGRRSTFLPQVWDQLPTPEVFVGQLKHKAGFATDFWADAVRLQRYTVAKWEEPEDPIVDPSMGGVTNP